MVVPHGWELVGGDPAPGEPPAYARLAEQLGRTATAGDVCVAAATALGAGALFGSVFGGVS